MTTLRSLFALLILTIAPACDPAIGAGEGDDFRFGDTSESGSDGGLGAPDEELSGIVCGSGRDLYVESWTACAAGYDVVCGVGSYLNPGTMSVCCVDAAQCQFAWWTNGCGATESHVCDIP